MQKIPINLAKINQKMKWVLNLEWEIIEGKKDFYCLKVLMNYNQSFFLFYKGLNS